MPELDLEHTRRLWAEVAVLGDADVPWHTCERPRDGWFDVLDARGSYIRATCEKWEDAEALADARNMPAILDRLERAEKVVEAIRMFWPGHTVEHLRGWSIDYHRDARVILDQESHWLRSIADALEAYDNWEEAT